MNKLPILLSIPHGGTEMPEELEGRVCLSSQDLFDDSDSFTRTLYDMKDHVIATVEAAIARAFIDVNREITDLPMENPDGVIKSSTCYNKRIYSTGKEPDQGLAGKLIDKYYLPYHDQILNILKTHKDIKFAIDCHSMATLGPDIAKDRGKERPLFCLGTDHGRSCSIEIAQRFTKCLISVFQLKRGDVLIDNPFSGGFIVKTYGNDPIPWLQLEMNRKLYLADHRFNASDITVFPEKLIRLQEKIFKTLLLFFDMSEKGVTP